MRHLLMKYERGAVFTVCGAIIDGSRVAYDSLALLLARVGCSACRDAAHKCGLTDPKS